MDGYFLIWAKVAHGKITDDITFGETGFQSPVFSGYFGLIYPQPQRLWALPEEGVTGF